MSYENITCPCGGMKFRETMLCPECVTAFAETSELCAMNDDSRDVGVRRSAAIRLLSMARKRKIETARISAGRQSEDTLFGGARSQSGVLR